MESSRGGPLTTFITTLPLIIVPAIAMLKPAGDGPGLVSQLLSASPGGSESAESVDTDAVGDASSFSEVEDEFDALFGDAPEIESFEEVNTEAEDSGFQDVSGDSLVDDFATDFGSPASAQATPPVQRFNSQPNDDATRQLLTVLQKMGATKTLWFSPGGRTFGFVAFFPDGPGMVSYRFEAIADSQAAAVGDVIRQVRLWQGDVVTMIGTTGRPWISGVVQSWSTRASAVDQAELQKSRFRSGKLYALRDRIDDSKLLASGRLIRSPRLARLEAALLISRGALSGKKLAQLAGLVDSKETAQLVELLNTSYDFTGSAFRVEKTATGYLMMTRPDLVSWLDRLHQRQSQMRLSQPMMETLTIVAYQQPITRASVEAVRGVQSSEMIRQLIDRGLVRVGGEEDSLGRPFLYITTRAFLDMFGLGRIEDLPNFETLGRKPELTPVEAAESSETTGDSDTEDATPAKNSAEDQQVA